MAYTSFLSAARRDTPPPLGALALLILGFGASLGVLRTSGVRSSPASDAATRLVATVAESLGGSRLLRRVTELTMSRNDETITLQFPDHYTLDLATSLGHIITRFDGNILTSNQRHDSVPLSDVAARRTRGLWQMNW